MSGDIQEAKQKLPLPALLHRLGLGEHAKKSARCPFHEDKRNSFSIWPRDGFWFWKCHTGCGDGDEITFLEKHGGISRSEAIKVFLEMGGVNGATSVRSQHLAKETSEQRFDWQQCVDAFTSAHLERLAEWRGYSLKFCSWLKEKGLVGLYDGHVAFPIRDESGKVVAVHYRLKNAMWQRYPTGHKTRPIVIGKLFPGEPIHAFESQWDAFAFMDKSGERSGIVITLGAENGKLIAGLAPQGATVYAWKQNDELKNEKRAGDGWLKDVAQHANAKVLWAKTPEQFKDINDWTRAGATCEDLLTSMVNAEKICEPEKSWNDALAESTVTSSELRNLKLTPRQKLLGDWLCEGDGGFIFASRGVGKTWLAVAMARTISKGGKLGEWEAHQPCKVLYIDSEMPPDLMRDRSIGLETSDNFQIINHDILFERSGKVLNIANPEIQNAITRRCVETGVKVLFIDNLSTAAFGLRENEADDWEKLSPWLLDLRRRKIAVVIIHHAGRSGEMRGTSKREDTVFWIIALDEMKKNADDKRGARFISHFTKPSRNTQEEVPAYEWHFVTEKTGQVTISHRLARTLDVFRSVIESGVTKCDEIADAMKVPKYVVSRMAKKAMDEGWLDKPKRGEYVLNEVRK